MRRTSIVLANKDFAAIEAIRQRYGVSTASEAIRLAFGILAYAENVQISPVPKQEAKESARIDT